MKKCPFCAEEIQDDAILCRYCGKSLIEEKLLSQKEINIKKKHQNGFLIAISWIVLVIGLIPANFLGVGIFVALIISIAWLFFAILLLTQKNKVSKINGVIILTIWLILNGITFYNSYQITRSVSNNNNYSENNKLIIPTQASLELANTEIFIQKTNTPNLNISTIQPRNTPCIPWESVIINHLGETMYVSGKVKSIFDDKSDYSDTNSYITLEGKSPIYQIITPNTLLYDFPIGSEICLHGRIILTHGKLFLDVIDDINYLNTNVTIPQKTQPVPPPRIMKIRIPTPDGGAYDNPLEDPSVQKTLGYNENDSDQKNGLYDPILNKTLGYEGP